MSKIFRHQRLGLNFSFPLFAAAALTLTACENQQELAKTRCTFDSENHTLTYKDAKSLRILNPDGYKETSEKGDKSISTARIQELREIRIIKRPEALDHLILSDAQDMLYYCAPVVPATEQGKEWLSFARTQFIGSTQVLVY